MDYIKRELIIEVLGKNSIVDKITHSDGKTIREKIMELPTANVVEVVRCKDCRYGTRAYGCLKKGKGLRGEFVQPNDFCSYGERTDT